MHTHSQFPFKKFENQQKNPFELPVKLKSPFYNLKIFSILTNSRLFLLLGFPAAAYAAYAAGRGFSGYPSFGLPYPTGNNLNNLATLQQHLTNNLLNNHHHIHTLNNHHHHTTLHHHPLLQSCYPHLHHHHPLEHLNILSATSHLPLHL